MQIILSILLWGGIAVLLIKVPASRTLLPAFAAVILLVLALRLGGRTDEVDRQGDYPYPNDEGDTE